MWAQDRITKSHCKQGQNCVNTIGSYTCHDGCSTGYREHKGACVDVDECKEGSHNCGQTEECLNRHGLFTPNRNRIQFYFHPNFNLTVISPWLWIYLHFLDIFLGSFRCISNNCPEGYRTEHGKCIDIDECHLGVHTCPGSREILSSNSTINKLFKKTQDVLILLVLSDVNVLKVLNRTKGKFRNFYKFNAISLKWEFFMKFSKKIK